MKKKKKETPIRRPKAIDHRALVVGPSECLCEKKIEKGRAMIPKTQTHTRHEFGGQGPKAQRGRGTRPPRAPTRNRPTQKLSQRTRLFSAAVFAPLASFFLVDLAK
ncbi:hypothetical protein pdul_cds_57 [Pandoravirus dulcis]|uniref:Uncharacterized protein n=1 Tax=Pandoravirus dulcis TaxID=1349409 RepID=A0A291ATW8_9VIRU|nr:hypothetical protein pdul_cds_57 [Pandoravirus dulcis]ATE82463.1 hypothetical protein pdul_cds_57 [Pandoravirus dulcis]